MPNIIAKYGQTGVYNSVLPSIVDGESAGIALDSSGRIIISATTGATSNQVQGNSASGAADLGNPVKVGGIFVTAQPTVTTGQRVDAQMTNRGAQIVATGVDSFVVQPAPYPSTATPLTATSGNVAAASAVATLAGTAGKTTYITGFDITAAGATAAAVVIAVLSGTITGSLNYIYTAPAGATVAAPQFTIDFATPVPASATNTAIVLTLPSLGAGNTNAAVNARGFQL